MAESLAIPPTLLFKLTETRGNEDRLKLIVRSLKAKFAETNDSKCVFTHPGDKPVIRLCELSESGKASFDPLPTLTILVNREVFRKW
mgnify:CR=1 FL=1